MRTHSRGLLASILIVGLAACGGGETPEAAPPEAEPPVAAEPAAEAIPTDMELPEGVTPAMVEAGQGIFNGPGVCHTCHMQGAVGGVLAPNLTDAEWLNVDGEYASIVELIQTGVAVPTEYPGMMPARAGVNLSDDDVAAVAAYVWSLSQ